MKFNVIFNQTVVSGARRFLFVLILFSGLFARAEASQEKEFIMSCTYGVLAGTLVGAASLAFISNPGDHLQTVARGASLGLYVGIGLGIYTVYVLPKQLEKEEEKAIENETGQQSRLRLPKFMVLPLVSQNGIDGVGAIWNIKQF